MHSEFEKGLAYKSMIIRMSELVLGIGLRCFRYRSRFN